MTEDDARRIVRSMTDVAGFDRLSALCDLVIRENEVQNLIARSTVDVIWNRHVLDSVQLLALAERAGRWLDIGTGGGFPGLAIAAADPDRPVVLVEPRRLRAQFLERAAAALELANVTVYQRRIEAVRDVEAAIISARAVAPVGKLLQAASHCATSTTRWLLLRGKTGDDDGMFHVKQSLSDSDARIVVIEGRAV